MMTKLHLTDAQQASADIRGELTRVDAKAGLLLSWAGGAFAVVSALTVAGDNQLSEVTQYGLWGASGLLAAAVALLLVAVRPRIPRTGGTGFVVYARAASPGDLAQAFAGDRSADACAEVHLLSRLTVAKYRTLAAATNLLLAALVVTVVALPLGALS